MHKRPELPKVRPGDELPFYYASLAVFEVLYLVPLQNLKPFPSGSALEPAVFEGNLGCVGFNFQMYTSQFNNSLGLTQEIELNVLAYPANRAAEVPELSFKDFVLGYDQTKLLGNHRVWVPCNDQKAIEAGVRKFGEEKFKTTFLSDVPAYDSPQTIGWKFSCCDPKHPADAGSSKEKQEEAEQEAIFTCKVDVKGLEPTYSNPSPITEYGTFKEEGAERPKAIGARWNILQPFSTYFLDEPQLQKRVNLTYGKSTHSMGQDMRRLIGDAPAQVARFMMSVPAAIQSRAYYL